MKKAGLILLTIFSSILLLTGCGNVENNKNNENTNTSQTPQKVEEKKVDLSTVDGRKEAMQKVIDEAYDAYKKGDESSKIKFMDKFYSQKFQFMTKNGNNKISVFNITYEKQFRENDSLGYKFKYNDYQNYIVLSNVTTSKNINDKIEFPQYVMYKIENNHVLFENIDTSKVEGQYDPQNGEFITLK